MAIRPGRINQAAIVGEGGCVHWAFMPAEYPNPFESGY